MSAAPQGTPSTYGQAATEPVAEIGLGQSSEPEVLAAGNSSAALVGRSWRFTAPADGYYVFDSFASGAADGTSTAASPTTYLRLSYVSGFVGSRGAEVGSDADDTTSKMWLWVELGAGAVVELQLAVLPDGDGTQQGTYVLTSQPDDSRLAVSDYTAGDGFDYGTPGVFASQDATVACTAMVVGDWNPSSPTTTNPPTHSGSGVVGDASTALTDGSDSTYARAAPGSSGSDDVLMVPGSTLASPPPGAELDHSTLHLKATFDQVSGQGSYVVQVYDSQGAVLGTIGTPTPTADGVVDMTVTLGQYDTERYFAQGTYHIIPSHNVGITVVEYELTAHYAVVQTPADAVDGRPESIFQNGDVDRSINGCDAFTLWSSPSLSGNSISSWRRPGDPSQFGQLYYSSTREPFLTSFYGHVEQVALNPNDPVHPSFLPLAIGGVVILQFEVRGADGVLVPLLQWFADDLQYYTVGGSDSSGDPLYTVPLGEWFQVDVSTPRSDSDLSVTFFLNDGSSFSMTEGPDGAPPTLKIAPGPDLSFSVFGSNYDVIRSHFDAVGIYQRRGVLQDASPPPPPPPPLEPAPAHHGTSSTRFVSDGSGRTSMLLHGPEGDQPHADVHLGAFLVSALDDPPTVSMQFEITGHEQRWVRVFAQWYTVVDGGLVPGSTDALTSRMPYGGDLDDDGDFVWSAISLLKGADRSSTHWRPRLVFYSDPDLDAYLPQGEEAFVDCIYVTEDGRSLDAKPYLDGDQPYGAWEGQPHASSSVYLDGPPTDF